jgi:hypothetical protein
MVLTSARVGVPARLERTAEASSGVGRNLGLASGLGFRPRTTRLRSTTNVPSLFHTVPGQLVGTVLYPLNELAHVDRPAWERERAKYEGREQVLELRVPPLECLWNDVLHLSPVHPADIAAELRAVGLEPLRSRFFEIDAADLEAARTVVFANRRARSADGIDASEWMLFEPDRLPALARFNGASRRYYRECAAAGARPRPWGYLPHVFHRGPLETRGLPIVEV